MQYGQDSYPADLSIIRDGILASGWLSQEQKHQLSSCRYRTRCNGTTCPNCLQKMAEKRKIQIIDGASQIASSRLKLVTLNAAYVPLRDLREASQVIIEASRAVLKKLGVTDFVLKLEDSVKDWQVGHKPHAHAIVSVPSGGSGFISPADWRNEWQTQLPAQLHPVQDAVDVRSIGDLMSRAGYVAKSPFARSALQSQEALDRTLAGIIEMKGIQKFNLRGVFQAA